jgi:hypothetical protein
MPIKLLIALPFALVLAGCQSGMNDQVNTTSEIEATTDQDIDGDGTIPQSGVEVGTSG